MQAGQKSVRVLAWALTFEWILFSAWMVANAASVRSGAGGLGTIVFPTYGQCAVAIALTILAIFFGYGFCRYRIWGLYGSLVLGLLTNVPLMGIAGSFLRGPGWGIGIACLVLVILFFVSVLVALKHRSLFQ